MSGCSWERSKSLLDNAQADAEIRKPPSGHLPDRFLKIRFGIAFRHNLGRFQPVRLGAIQKSPKAIPKQPRECRGRFARTRIRTDPQRPPLALAAQGRDRAGQWTWHRAPRHPHDPAVLGPAEVVGIPQGPPVLLRRRPRFIQRWGWRGDQGARSKTRTSVSSPLASVRLDSSASRAASPFCNLWPLTVSAPRATCT